jgi:nanoRNase/pAp phosphatase (c-di-AMP/oligoRNAs hydrolase)
LNRTSQINVGQLMLNNGGGGHTRVGTCQIPIEDWIAVRNELIEAVREAPVPAR